MSWSSFIWFAIPSSTLWLAAGVVVYSKKYRRTGEVIMLLGILLFASFISGLWVSLERPPMRTMGETRLWYSFFLSAVGYAAYRRWKYPWLLSYCSVVATVFVIINLLKPEIHSKNLMPALQSIWFVPHVTVYILSYAMLGAATVGSLIQLNKIAKGRPDMEVYNLTDNLVYAGFGFLMLGMLMGCVWAKQAWGHYWSWDPKETWAFITAAAYLLYVHMRLRNSHPKLTSWILPVSFVLLLITWIGVSYLPSAQASIHVY